MIKIDYTPVEGIYPWVRLENEDLAHSIIVNDWPIWKEVWSEYLESADIIVQAGGYQGLYPRLYSEYFNLVYTFEPTATNFYCLARNCNKENIVKMQASLGSSTGLTGIKQRAHNNLGMNQAVGDGLIPKLSIDCLNLPACSMIQLDVEGGEISALIGAYKTIKMYKPLIQLETNYTDSVKALRLLEPFGYHIVAEFPEETFYSIR